MNMLGEVSHSSATPVIRSGKNDASNAELYRYCEYSELKNGMQRDSRP